ncbi:MAG: O-antigen ligase family protein [Phenylobacterium sp.]|uniref:O-antigen ligase family protein n=1 Tax=Phenylobacterium sp. TaxID=1871053 RepID=UPI00391C6421
MNEAYEDDGWAPTPLAVEAATALFVLTALVAGGSSSSPLMVGVVRLAAIPVLAMALWRASTWPPARGWIWPMLLLVAAAALTLAQLVPLPPQVWSALPGRELVAEGYATAGLALPVLPISLAPQATLSALLGLLPPAAAFAAVLGLDEAARRRLMLLVAAVALTSIGLGMLQMAGGERSGLRLYDVTNLDSAVGFFANRNHQASFLVAAIPLAAALAASLGRRRSRTAFMSILAVSVVVVLIVGVAVTRSRAGVALLVPAFAGALAITLRGRPRRKGLQGLWPVLAMGGAIVLGGALVAVFSFTPLAQRFAAPEETRPRIAAQVLDAGFDYAPFGSGVGSFAPVYRIHEPAQRLLPAFVNHAHNDYAEIWLEASWPGLALVAGFLAWWAGAVFAVARDWRAQGRGLQLAGASVTGIYLLHSLADYPLRTPAASVLFALACGLMIAPAWVLEHEPPPGEDEEL